jgi:hypothetical protein
MEDVELEHSPGDHQRGTEDRQGYLPAGSAAGSGGRVS